MSSPPTDVIPFNFSLIQIQLIGGLWLMVRCIRMCNDPPCSTSLHYFKLNCVWSVIPRRPYPRSCQRLKALISSEKCNQRPSLYHIKTIGVHSDVPCSYSIPYPMGHRRIRVFTRNRMKENSVGEWAGSSEILDVPIFSRLLSYVANRASSIVTWFSATHHRPLSALSPSLSLPIASGKWFSKVSIIDRIATFPLLFYGVAVLLPRPCRASRFQKKIVWTDMYDRNLGILVGPIFRNKRISIPIYSSSCFRMA